MKTTTTLILSLLLVVSAQARLNETLEQCEKRYGAPTSKDADKAEVSFEKAGITITAHFHQGKVDAIKFANVNGPFEDAEIRVLAESNMGQTWRAFNPETGAAADLDTNAHLATQFFDILGEIHDENREVFFYTTGYRERKVGDKIKDGDAGRRLKGF